MSRHIAMVALCAVIAQGCTKKLESYSLTSKPGYYPMASFVATIEVGIASSLPMKPISFRTRWRWLPSSVQRTSGAPDSRNLEGSPSKDFEEM